MPEWDEKIIEFSDYSFFHTSYWSQVVADTYSYSPFYFIIQSLYKRELSPDYYSAIYTQYIAGNKTRFVGS